MFYHHLSSLCSFDLFIYFKSANFLSDVFLFSSKFNLIGLTDVGDLFQRSPDKEWQFQMTNRCLCCPELIVECSKRMSALTQYYSSRPQILQRKWFFQLHELKGTNIAVEHCTMIQTHTTQGQITSTHTKETTLIRLILYGRMSCWTEIWAALPVCARLFETYCQLDKKTRLWSTRNESPTSCV